MNTELQLRDPRSEGVQLKDGSRVKLNPMLEAI